MGLVIVRPIAPDELQAARDIGAIAFAFARDEQKESAPDPQAHTRIRAAFDDAGRMTACLQILPFRVWLGQSVVDMGGIGGVASLPETRRQGNIRAIFQASLREMWDRGMVLSALYPFSHPYYRQYGYELVRAARTLTVPMAAFSAFKPTSGSLRQYMPGQDDAPLRQVYAAFTRGRNLAPLRTDELWQKWLHKDPYATCQYTYLWYDGTGEARSYAVLQAENRPEGRALLARDVACCDLAALRELFGLFYSMGAQYHSFVWPKMPGWIDACTLFPEPYDAALQIERWGMARVLRVADALSYLPHPAEPGAYTLAVTDTWLPENQGLWRVDFCAGKAQVRRAPQGPADMDVDIPTLTQLVLGYLDLETLLWSRPGAVAPRHNADTLRRVFVRRQVYMPEYF
ncbi:MAG: GNAT family N-acetyltransferase [Oscillospiraceae bacterium]|nr:GNAT family N-acetyltransferase [Oscillospiraceae bacterium]